MSDVAKQPDYDDTAIIIGYIVCIEWIQFLGGIFYIKQEKYYEKSNVHYLDLLINVLIMLLY